MKRSVLLLMAMQMVCYAVPAFASPIPIVEYTFGDGNASVAANTGSLAGGMNGTVTGGSIVASPFSADNQALLLGGQAGHGVAMPNGYDFGAAFTVETLFRLDALGSSSNIIFDDFGGPGVVLQVLSSQLISLSVSTAGGVVALQSLNPVALGQWYHVAATYDGASVKLFVNGGNDASGGGSGLVQNHGAVVPHIGLESGGSVFPWLGALDDFRIYESALQISEFNGGNALPAHANPVPEPSTLLLLGSGLLGAVGCRRLRSSG